MSEGTGQVSPGVAGLCILQFLTSYQYNSGLLLDRTSFYSQYYVILYYAGYCSQHPHLSTNWMKT